MTKLILALFLATLATASYIQFSKSIISSSSHQVFLKKVEQADQQVDSWSLFSLPAFSGYAIRTKKPNGKLCDDATEQVVGYLDTGDDKHFFFWFFESRNQPATDPLILWLNGGPGCSSLTGLLMELGPCRVQPGGNSTKPNPHSWNNNANVIFLDQPINAGFSYSDSGEVSSSEEAAEDVFAFLQLFLNKYNKYSGLEFHVTGESYAGHYIPAIAKVITEAGIKKQKKSKKLNIFEDQEISINLKSLAIGNGLTDPLVQYEYYPDMACDSNYGPILPQEKCDEMRGKVGTCTSLISACYKYESRFTCVPGSIYCNNALIRPVQETGKNLYDIRTDCQPNNPLCYGIIQDIETYMNLPHVQKIIGVDREFKGCNMDVNMKFLMNGDWMKPFVRNIPDILEMGIDVLIYAGDADFICNWMGNKAWTLDLDWSGKEEYNAAQDMEWTSKKTGKPAGEYRAFGGFAFLRVFEAGHMVPYDQPEHSSEFIDYWIGQRDVLGRRGNVRGGRKDKHHHFYKH